jgi:hypothetical protein
LDAAAEARLPVVQWVRDHPSSRWPAFHKTTSANSAFAFLSPYSEAYFRTFIMPEARTGWSLGTGTSRHSRIEDASFESYLARDIPCLLPLNLARIGGTLHDAERRLEALPYVLGAAAWRQSTWPNTTLKHRLSVTSSTTLHRTAF